jgi:hypothetical protein
MRGGAGGTPSPRVFACFGWLPQKSSLFRTAFGALETKTAAKIALRRGSVAKFLLRGIPGIA